MKNQTGFRVLVAFTLLLLIGSQSAQAQDAWTEYKPEDGSFRVELPGRPIGGVVAPPLGSQSILRAEAVIVDRRGTERYEVKYMNYTDGYPGAAKDRIKNIVDNAPKLFGTIELSENLKIGSASAVHLVFSMGTRIKSGDPLIVTTVDDLLVATDDALIQILCIVLSNRKNADLIERIHKSLSLTGS